MNRLTTILVIGLTLIIGCDCKDSAKLKINYYTVYYYSAFHSSNAETFTKSIATCNFLFKKLELPHRLKFGKLEHIPTRNLDSLDKQRSYVNQKAFPAGTSPVDSIIHVFITSYTPDGQLAVTAYDKTGLISISQPYEYDPVVMVHEVFHRLTRSLNHTNPAGLGLEADQLIPKSKNCLNLLAANLHSPFGINLTQEQQTQYAQKSQTPIGYSSNMTYPRDTIMQNIRMDFTCCSLDSTVSEAYIDSIYNLRPLPWHLSNMDKVGLKASFRTLDSYNVCLIGTSAAEMDSLANIVAVASMIQPIDGFPRFQPNIQFPTVKNMAYSHLQQLYQFAHDFDLTHTRSQRYFVKEAKYLQTEGGLSVDELESIRSKGYETYRIMKKELIIPTIF